jgi:hypothetical protein
MPSATHWQLPCRGVSATTSARDGRNACVGQRNHRRVRHRAQLLWHYVPPLRRILSDALTTEAKPPHTARTIQLLYLDLVFS